MNSWIIIGVLALYIAALFACAFFGEKYASRLSARGRVLLFSLTLGVYCSSWTFYGAVGETVRNGIGFLPIYLGPLLFMWFAYDIWRRLGQIRQHQSISSIADFIAARYGKSGGLAALVTILAVIAILPYLALQLRAVAMSTVVLLGEQQNAASTTQGVMILTALLAGIAMLFGTRQLAHSEQHGGLMVAVAFESAVKLFALLMVSMFTLFFSQHPFPLLQHDVISTLQTVQYSGLPSSFWTQTLLAAAAIICLPRQFHVAVVELKDQRHIRGARFWFSLYLVLMVVAIVPIASWALHMPTSLLPIPDLAVLMLPILHDQAWLALLAFIGGFSAATGMLLVATLALSIMLSNDLILPALWRFNLLHRQDQRLAFWIKMIRRVCIALVMLLGFLVYRLLSDINQLSAFGLLAFSAVIQFAPALIGGLYWRGGSRQGVVAGLLAGFTLWGYTLFWPAILRNMPAVHQDWALAMLHQGIWGLGWLKPEALLGFASLDPLTHGVVWSLGLNLLLFVGVSRYKRLSIAEQIQTENFFQFDLAPATLPTSTDTSQSNRELAIERSNHFDYGQGHTRLTIGDLIALSARINGSQKTEAAFIQFASDQQLHFDKNMLADHHWWRFTEQYLAQAVGAASARTLLTTALVDNGLAVGQVVNILDQASRWQRFNQSLLMTMMNHMTQAVSVVDADMRLVAWNKRYIELFDYPEDFVYVGCPVANLIRYNAERGECGPGDVETHVNKRIGWMRAGNAHEFERQRADGRIIEMRGYPISGGGFVTTYADITVFRHTEALLEARVQERTRQLETALHEQQSARQQADLANMSKTRFVAAASHDLLQPMHAARLFAAALEQAELAPTEQQTLQQLDRALHGAESILSALLDIARLDGNGIKPNIADFALAELLHDLQVQFSPVAEQRNLKLHVYQSSLWIKTDPQWLRRMLQNLVSNALRYTAQGRVVVGVRTSRQQPGYLQLGVWDTGPGISPQQQAHLFAEFQRGGHPSPWGEQGIGLGLAIVDRMAKRLNHPIRFHSVVGKGSCFMLELPVVTAQHPVSTPVIAAQHALNQLKVLCVDNDPTILQGMQVLLSKWGCTLFLAQTPEQARQILAQQPIQVLLVDQHLEADIEGLDFLHQYNKRQLPAALITADSDPQLPLRVKEMGIVLLKKPLKPAALRAFLAGIVT
ncbi:PAS-domain containing protein [Alkanindiges sp. WGS2144]|uniref:PAS domain-containing hybrid sensor histidine kinase/response regulator n=1 Tax=Alkanindiges sp. WGS2144 TaxID=3366808 RepID=UPI0037513A8A